MLVAVLSTLLTLPPGSVLGSARAPAPEEESQGESPAEEDVESLGCLVNRDELFDGKIPPAVKSLVAAPRRADPRLSRPTPVRSDVAARNGCGGPLRC
jgi:hypothetical protein